MYPPLDDDVDLARWFEAFHPKRRVGLRNRVSPLLDEFVVDLYREHDRLRFAVGAEKYRPAVSLAEPVQQAGELLTCLAYGKDLDAHAQVYAKVYTYADPLGPAGAGPRAGQGWGNQPGIG